MRKPSGTKAPQPKAGGIMTIKQYIQMITIEILALSCVRSIPPYQGFTDMTKHLSMAIAVSVTIDTKPKSPQSPA